MKKNNSISLSICLLFTSLVVILPVIVSPAVAGSSTTNLKQQLIDADTKLNQAYHKLRKSLTKSRNLLLKGQKKWLVRRDTVCKLKGLPESRDQWITAIAKDKEKAECVIGKTMERTKTLLALHGDKNRNTQRKVASRSKYELVKGKGIAVCEAYEKSLNSLQPKLPMVCGRSVSSELGFGKPDWKQDMKQTGVIFGPFSELLWTRDVNPVRYFRVDLWPQWKGTPAQYQKAHKSYRVNRDNLWAGRPPLIARFDIDNDGKPEPVYFEHPCGSVYGDLLAVLTPDGKKIDRKKTELVMPHSPIKKLGLGYFRPVKKGDYGIGPSSIAHGYTPVEDAPSDAHYDVFLYKDQAYFDQWWSGHPNFKGKSDIEAGLLKVFQAKSGRTKEVCTYRFNYK